MSSDSNSGVQRSRLTPSTYCPFCSDGLDSPVVDSDTPGAFSLSSLFPCGAIIVSIRHDGESPCPGISDSNDNSWHPLPVRNLSTHPVDALFRQLAFLIRHLFLRATCRLGSSGRVIFIRIYLIPNDLPSVYGRLHRRPENVIKEARRHLHNVIPLIEQNHGLWDADETCLNIPQTHFLPSHIDNRTMAEIYSDLPSPELGPVMNEKAGLSHRIASGDAICGLRTTLYGYQRHSVAIMLHRESSTSPVPDPTYVGVSCMSGTRFYIQPSTMTVLRECPMFSPSQSGILCEELGTGKTVMIIALVLATANQLAEPEFCQVDERPVMTPLAYHHFPTTEHALARERAGLGQRVIQQVPSLVEVLVHHLSLRKATPGGLNFSDELEASHMWPLIRANKPFYHHFDTDLALQELKRSRRQPARNLSPRTMYLSSATLVIVPLTLLGQWKNEVDKHCHDSVRYLVVRPSMVLPDARKLASDYELIIMSDTRFRRESKKSNTKKLYSLKPCTCPCLVGSRIPDCHCPGDPTVTPLLQVRWKRVVIDEGHTAGNVAAAINHFVQQLSIQHKWIVTGTPTSNILGLQLGRTTDEQESDQYTGSVEPVLIYPDPESVEAVSSSQDNGNYVRVWGSYDSLNLRKLGTMIRDFVGVPQFHAEAKSFAGHVSLPLCDQRGPRPGAIKVLNQVMQMVMVRHKVEDVEKDVVLPPMDHSIIYMDLGNYAVKSYNAMQAALAINAIDSEREGTDYLFHPSKAKELRTTINNSMQGLFWSSSDILYNVHEIHHDANGFMARAIKRKVVQEDLDLLQQALNHAAAAANDRVWKAMQPHPDIPFNVSGLDPAVFAAWTRTGSNSDVQTAHFMHPDRLMNLRSLVRRKPLISREDLIEMGHRVGRKENIKMALTSMSSREVKHADQTKEMAKEVRGTIEVLKKHVERMNTSEDEFEFEVPKKRRDKRRIASAKANAAHTTESAHLSDVKVGPSLSTKLNYILSEVQQYSAKEKFLIFSNSLLTLFQVGEALSLFEIKHLRYSNEEDYLLREQCILTFETSDVYRVLLMDLKLGARGLNLISASRVIFCEPVWHPDVESQAIKRVHRIGQTRPVTVKTLVIRSTAEEAMVTRRQYLRSSDKVPTNMMTESGMRHYLQHPHFLSESTRSEPISIVLSLDDNRVVDMQSGEMIGVAIEPDTPAGLPESRAMGKRVRFE